MINVTSEVFVKLSSCLVVRSKNVMNIMSINDLTILKKGFVFLGIFLLVLSVLISLAVLIGLFDLNDLEVLGHSGLRSVAAIAVLGCLLAAIGYHDG